MSTIPSIPLEVILTFFLTSLVVAITLNFQAAKPVQEGVRQNYEEMQKKGIPVGKTRKTRLNWPNESLDIATKLWSLCTLFFAMAAASSVIGDYTGTTETTFVLFAVGSLLLIGAIVDTFNTNAFAKNPKYQPVITSGHVMRGIMVGGFLVIDGAEAFLTLLIYEVRPTVPSWFAALGIVFVISMGASVFLILTVVRLPPKKKWLNEIRPRVAFWLFCSPMVYLLIVGLIAKYG